MYNAAERWLSTLREFNLLKAKGPAVLNIEYNSFGYGRQNARQHLHLVIQTHILRMCVMYVMC